MPRRGAPDRRGPSFQLTLKCRNSYAMAHAVQSLGCAGPFAGARSLVGVNTYPAGTLTARFGGACVHLACTRAWTSDDRPRIRRRPPVSNVCSYVGLYARIEAKHESCAGCAPHGFHCSPASMQALVASNWERHEHGMAGVAGKHGEVGQRAHMKA